MFHTIFPLKISPEIQWAYSYTYIGPLGPHMGPQKSNMGPQMAQMLGLGPMSYQCHTIFPLKILPAIQWAYSYT